MFGCRFLPLSVDPHNDGVRNVVRHNSTDRSLARAARSHTHNHTSHFRIFTIISEHRSVGMPDPSNQLLFEYLLLLPQGNIETSPPRDATP